MDADGKGISPVPAISARGSYGQRDLLEVFPKPFFTEGGHPAIQDVEDGLSHALDFRPKVDLPSVLGFLQDVEGCIPADPGKILGTLKGVEDFPYSVDALKK